MTSRHTSFPTQFTQIDDSVRSEHFRLCKEHQCYFLGEYTSREGFDYSATNELIMNLKKEMDRKEMDEWQYKGKAIENLARSFSMAFSKFDPKEYLNIATLVPIPSSKARSNPLYDDRMTKVLKLISPESGELDIRELLYQLETFESTHLTESTRPTSDDMESRYHIDERLVTGRMSEIALFDDVITTGAHFVGAKRVLLKQFPNATIRGFFAARRVLLSG